MKRLNMEEKYLAIVLLDIIGSTAFVQRSGAHKAAAWFQVHDRLTRNLIYRYNGREIDRSDGFLLSFERVIDAINFGLAYQKEVPKKTKLQCRIGIHWGKVVEVKQEDKYVGAGAKRVELEGLAKNIAARTMSLCQAGQVLLTKEAVVAVRSRVNANLSKDARIVCVGLYSFKGVAKAQEIYAVGETIESLQPPQGSDKVKRLGGPKYIKQRARDRKFKDWIIYIYGWIARITIIFWLSFFFYMSLTPSRRTWIGMPYYMPKYDAVIQTFTNVYNHVTSVDDPKRKKRHKR